MSLWKRVFVERRRSMLALVALLLVNAGVLGLAVLPLKAVVASNADRAQLARLELAQAQTRMKQAQLARTSKDRAQADLKKFYADVLPADFTNARHITHLEIARIGQECGLKPGPRDFEPVLVKNSQLGEFRTEVSFTGEYPSIRKFIYELETSQSFLVVRSVAVGQASQQKGNVGGSLQITLLVSTFYLGAK